MNKLFRALSIDAGFNDLSLPVYEIDSKAARINAIFFGRMYFQSDAF
jgi:hypothetical protein